MGVFISAPLITTTATTYSPTITLVGGAGNTVPQYTTTTTGVCQSGNVVFVDLYFVGDGGNEGAGTGQMNITLPKTASSTHPTTAFSCGYALNNTTSYELYGAIDGSGTTIYLSYFSVISTLSDFTGTQQNNTSRDMRFKFFYYV